jgi:flagellar biosynthesis protein FlhG
MVISKKGKSEIWAIGGGKGGVGKSFVICSMGNYLAQGGKRVVLVDADLGGANLHTFLGVEKPRFTLTDFFDEKLPLADLVVDSGIRNMGLLIGTIRSLDPDNIKHTQKLKFFRHIKELDADYVLIDLGAGTHLNTIDTFLLADKMIVVFVPEIIAIENMYFFIKTAFFRKLTGSLGVNGYKEVVRDTWKKRKQYDIANLKQFVEHLKQLSSPVENIINRELSRFKIYIISNKIKSNQEIRLGDSVRSICMKYFGFDAQYVGYIEYDDSVSRSINKRQPYMENYPESRCAKEIGRLTQNLLEGKAFGTRFFEHESRGL